MNIPVHFTGVTVLRSNVLDQDRYKLTLNYMKQSITFGKRYKKVELFNIASIIPITNSVKTRIRVVFQNNEYVVLSYKDHLKLFVALVNLERVCNQPSLFVPAMHLTVLATVSKSLRETVPQADDLSATRPPILPVPHLHQLSASAFTRVGVAQ